MIDGERGTGALRRSWELVQGFWWRTFGLVVVVNLVVATLLALVISAPFTAIADEHGPAPSGRSSARSRRSR